MKKFTKLLFIGLFACLMLLTVVFAVGCKPDDDPVNKLTFKEPISGKGTASYLSEIISGDLRNMRLDTNSTDFSPYEVEEGSYKVRFNSASQKIYYRFKAPKVAVYEVYSSTLEEAVDPTITLFHGDQAYTGYINPKMISDEDSDESGYYSDNKSDTDKNFYLEITCLDSNLMQDNGRFLFELNLADPAGVNKEFAITFAYKGEYVPPKEPVKTVKEATQIKDFTLPNGTWVDAPLSIDEIFDPVYNPEDGYYHRNYEDGEIIYAVMGRAPLNEGDDAIAPRGLELGFKQQYENANSFIESDGVNYEIDWNQLMLAYAENSMESYGRHPVTPELKDFLDYYINRRSGTKSYIEETLSERLPTGKEWIWACGYYQATEDFPYTLAAGENSISLVLDYENNLIPFWADFYTRGDGTYVITAESTNLKMAWYGQLIDSEPTEITSTEEGFRYTFVGEPQSRYIMCFTTINGAAEELSVSIDFEDSSEPNGTWDHPFILDNDNVVGTLTGEITSAGASIYYNFTPSENINLKITCGEKTTVSIQYQDEMGTDKLLSSEENFDGGVLTMEFKAGTIYKFIISSTEAAGGNTSVTIERA